MVVSQNPEYWRGSFAEEDVVETDADVHTRADGGLVFGSVMASRALVRPCGSSLRLVAGWRWVSAGCTW